MRKIVYYVAVSLDGYISGKNDDISQFIMQGEGVDHYQSNLADFGTVIMGRKTYEFGFQYGLEPGQPAYPNMKHYIFSNSLKIDNLSEWVSIENSSVARIMEIKETADTDIYLCGGGEFAGWLLDHRLIDQLKLKVNPIVLGSGTKLFGSSTTSEHWESTSQLSFSDGMQILTYDRKD